LRLALKLHGIVSY